MKRMQSRVFGVLLALSLLVPFQSAMAKKPPAPGALTLPLAGTVAGGGTFSGTVTINRFARAGDGGIVAVGIVRGTVTNAAGQVVTGLQTVALPVNGRVRTAGFETAPSAEPRLVPATFTKATSGRFILAQAASCQILNLDIGPHAVNLLGFMVNLSAITLDIAGDSAGPLGALVCEIVELLGTAADVVGLLNDLLGLLTGLLGGVVGGIGGIGG
jgi:hypothetical protein